MEVEAHAVGNRYRNEEPVFHSNPGGGRKRERNVSSDLSMLTARNNQFPAPPTRS